MDDRTQLAALEIRIKALLPETYEDCYESVQPVSMGSAGLRFDPDGRVAWDEMWASFCDLAMAGGPPHKGTLLEPAVPAEIDAQPEQYRAVVEEICRGVTMVTDLRALSSPVPGWVRVMCFTEGMAAWLLRAIVMENIAARVSGNALDLPAAPHFRVEKEVKNVVTVMAKTCHYWVGHTSRARQRAIAELLGTMNEEAPLVEPPAPGEGGLDAESQRRLVTQMAEIIHRETGLRASAPRYRDWFGIECPNVDAAIWMMRAIVASNVLARREGTVLFVPLNPARDSCGDRVMGTVIQTHRFARLAGALPDQGT